MAIGIPLMPFCLNARFPFLADLLCVPLRHDIDKGRKLQRVGFLAVNAVVDRDKAHIVPSEYLHRVAGLEIVVPPAGKVFHNIGHAHNLLCVHVELLYT